MEGGRHSRERGGGRRRQRGGEKEFDPAEGAQDERGPAAVAQQPCERGTGRLPGGAPAEQLARTGR
ncbi:hypothetical protein ABZ554_41430, partial [Streptomyces sp. NPDC020125]|uniref:hypothetical protein n=1 Tax=Streptomyces sp. NPDC020125 TaxID=3154593 RepID=UPI00340B6DA9